MGHFSARDSMKGTLGEGSFTGTPKDILSRARKWAFSAIGAPLWGKMEGHFFLRVFFFGGICMRFSRDMQNAL
jgi:hypothetical protein